MVLMQYGYLPLTVQIIDNDKKKILNLTGEKIVDEVLLIHAGK